MSDPDGPTGAGEVERGGWRAALARLSQRFGARMLGMAYPAQCPGCETGTAAPGALCGTCWRQMPFIARPFCERLGTPFSLDIGGPLLSPIAIADPPVFDRARAVALHDGIAREFVHGLKFGDRLDLVTPMGNLMARAGADTLDRADMLVPVPLHWTRLLRRRFNQSALLADAIGRTRGIPVRHDLIRRRKRTIPQPGLTRSERQQNLHGAFEVPASVRPQLEGLHVVLVDDVRTTGATLNAGARILLKAGAASVDVVTFTVVAQTP